MSTPLRAATARLALMVGLTTLGLYVASLVA